MWCEWKILERDEGKSNSEDGWERKMSEKEKRKNVRGMRKKIIMNVMREKNEWEDIERKMSERDERESNNWSNERKMSERKEREKVIKRDERESNSWSAGRERWVREKRRKIIERDGREKGVRKLMRKKVSVNMDERKREKIVKIDKIQSNSWNNEKEEREKMYIKSYSKHRRGIKRSGKEER